ncbi:hypothetical protein [Planococcus maritimus]|uniref:hypothetical protein n=1 Tax=Planococcus maritimus TaxID=192421 RepID=UPI00114CE8EA|nr:hypothetical protein [Planococcus maritimus]
MKTIISLYYNTIPSALSTFSLKKQASDRLISLAALKIALASLAVNSSSGTVKAIHFHFS